MIFFRKHKYINPSAKMWLYILLFIILIILALIYFPLNDSIKSGSDYIKGGFDFSFLTNLFSSKNDKYSEELNFIDPIVTDINYYGDKKQTSGRTLGKIDKYFESIKQETPSEEYLNARFVRNVNNIDIYADPTYNREFKVYPLCCLECELDSLQELRYLKDLSAEYSNSIPFLFSKPYTINISPNSNIKKAKEYLVIERESLRLIDKTVKNIDYDSFVELLKMLQFIKEKYNKYIVDLSINNLGLDKNNKIKILNLNQLKPITPETNIYVSRISILNKLNPALFGEYKNEYLDLAHLMKNNKINFNLSM